MENFGHSACSHNTKRIYSMSSVSGLAMGTLGLTRGGTTPAGGPRVSVYRHGTRQGSGDGAEAQGQHDDWGCTCLNGACGWLRQTQPRAVSRRTRSTPRTRITRLGAVP